MKIWIDKNIKRYHYRKGFLTKTLHTSSSLHEWHWSQTSMVFSFFNHKANVISTQLELSSTMWVIIESFVGIIGVPLSFFSSIFFHWSFLCSLTLPSSSLTIGATMVYLMGFINSAMMSWSETLPMILLGCQFSSSPILQLCLKFV